MFLQREGLKNKCQIKREVFWESQSICSHMNQYNFYIQVSNFYSDL